MADKIETKVIADVDTKEASKSIRDLREQINTYRDAAVKASRGTKEYNDAIANAAKLQKQLSNITQDLRANSLTLNQQFTTLTQGLSGVSAGFSAVTSIVALFDDENSKLAQTLVRVQSALALTQSLQAFAGGIRAANTAWRVFDSTLKSSPIFLVVTTILAVTGAVAGLVSVFRTGTSVTDDFAAAQNRLSDSYERQNNELEREIRLQASLGASIEDQIYLRRESIKRQIAEQEQLVDLIRAQIQAIKDIPRNQWILQDFIDIKGLNKQLQEATMILDGFYKTQIKLNDDYDINFNNKNRTEADKRRQIALQEQKQRLEAERQLQEALLNSWESFWTTREKREQETNDRRRQSLRNVAYEFEEEAQDFFNNLEPAQVKIFDQIYDFTSLEAIEQRRQAYEDEIANLTALYQNTEESIENRRNAYRKLQTTMEQFQRFEQQAGTATKKIEDGKAKATQAAYNAIASTLSNAASIAGQNTAAGKALGVASATISTYAGAAQALNDTLVPTPVKWANFAATISTGLSAVKNILAVKVPGASSDSSEPAAAILPTMPRIDTSFVETHNNYDAYDEDLLNQSQKVYVTETDLRQVNNRVEVAESNATF